VPGWALGAFVRIGVASEAIVLGQIGPGEGAVALAGQVAVDHARALAALVDRPHDQRLAAAGITGREDAVHRGGVGLDRLHIAAWVLLHAELIEHGALVLNLETYQAAVAGRVLDLTYMEYELLRFLAGHPAKVFTRETLLSRVWGYEYYGGARTVDVHIRRLRAKLGEEHAHLIQTVRSVGYRFGQVAWHPGATQRNGVGPAPAPATAPAAQTTGA